MDKEYILSFSSFYKAAYARDILGEYGINSVLRKLPPELIRSCGTGLYLRTSSMQRPLEIFAEKEIVPRSIYMINHNSQNDNGQRYSRV